MKKKKRRRKAGKIILLILAALALLAGIVILLFRTRSIQVQGNEYYGETSISTWIENDKLSVNTLYILLKYNFTDADLPSAVESMHASLKNPWTVRVTVREKEMLGYVDNNGSYLYFDENGIVVLNAKRLIEGVPHIEGLEFDAAKAEIGKELPVEDDGIFSRIMDVSNYLTKNSLGPDRLVCQDGSITLYFGSIEVLLGTGNYEDKLAQVEPILEKLNENYPDIAGTLHLENYDASSSGVRFVPEKEKEETEKSE